jgi:hypothetical protein
LSAQIASLHDILGLSTDSEPCRLSNKNILDEVEKRCGKHNGVNDDEWRNRLLVLQAQGHAILGLHPPPPDSQPLKGEEQTTFGEVLEVYTAKGIHKLNEGPGESAVLLADVHDGLDDGIRWKPEHVFLLDWNASQSLCVVDCIATACPDPTLFIQFLEDEFS